jgi:hypothetical protein
MLDATFSGDLEGLLRTTVRLHLWHSLTSRLS